jgi:hypothetical protein
VQLHEEGVTVAATYTNFVCRATGGGASNMNAGTLDGSTTIPNGPAVTYTGGAWTAATDIFTAAVGADMTEAQVGRFCSIYADGDTVPTTNQFTIRRITAVDSGARTITAPVTNGVNLGTELTDGAANRTLRIGGAHAGPSGASGFPLNFLTTACTNTSGSPPKINLKNDQSHAMTAAITHAAGNVLNFQGFTSAYGDGGLAVIDGGTSGSAYSLFAATTTSLAGARFLDLEFKNNGASGGSTSIHGLSLGTGGGWHIWRCVFRDLRSSGAGAIAVTQGGQFEECEFYSCNQGSIAGCGGTRVTGGAVHSFVDCIFHNNNVAGVFGTTSTAKFVGCIFDSNTGVGFDNGNTDGASFVRCDFYANTSHGINSTLVVRARNCNFIDNGGYAFSGPSATYTSTFVNCGFGTGTMANVSGNFSTTGLVEEIGSITYAANVTPWVDPDNGDFRINLAAAQGTGRGTFLQTASGYAGTVGYPDVGASQHLESVAPAASVAIFTSGRQ